MRSSGTGHRSTKRGTRLREPAASLHAMPHAGKENSSAASAAHAHAPDRDGGGDTTGEPDTAGEGCAQARVMLDAAREKLKRLRHRRDCVAAVAQEPETVAPEATAGASDARGEAGRRAEAAEPAMSQEYSRVTDCLSAPSLLEADFALIQQQLRAATSNGTAAAGSPGTVSSRASSSASLAAPCINTLVAQCVAPNAVPYVLPSLPAHGCKASPTLTQLQWEVRAGQSVAAGASRQKRASSSRDATACQPPQQRQRTTAHGRNRAMAARARASEKHPNVI